MTGCKTAAIAALVLLAACFEPSYEEGIECGVLGSCPDSLICSPVDERCYRELPDPTCDDGVANGSESDVDCGGDCPACADGQSCGVPGECQSQVCSAGRCAAPSCGDAVVNQPSEVCDDGPDSATCDADCTPAMCGDRTVNPQAGEECDEGAADTALCDADCSFPVCGDGSLNPRAGEECEDGNATPGDGCSELCALEYRASCQAILDAGESVGDGLYTIDTDGVNQGQAPFAVYCDMTTRGGGWTRVFREDTGNGVFFEVDQFERNKDDPQADLYAILLDLESFRRDGELEFLMRWPGHPIYDDVQHWAQTSNPVLDAPGTLPLGYRDIYIPYTDNGWSAGLQRSVTTDYSLLDGTLSPLSNWYYAVGTTYCWGTPGSCQPAPSGGARIAELLVR